MRDFSRGSIFYAHCMRGNGKGKIISVLCQYIIFLLYNEFGNLCTANNTLLFYLKKYMVRCHFFMHYELLTSFDSLTTLYIFLSLYEEKIENFIKW